MEKMNVSQMERMPRWDQGNLQHGRWNVDRIKKGKKEIEEHHAKGSSNQW